MTGKRRQYSAELKAKVSLEALRGELTKVQLAPSTSFPSNTSADELPKVRLKWRSSAASSASSRARSSVTSAGHLSRLKPRYLALDRYRSINAMAETFFKTLKSEIVWRTKFETRQDAEQAIGRYIDGFYNRVRRHSALDFTSLAQFEKLAAS